MSLVGAVNQKQLSSRCIMLAAGKVRPIKMFFKPRTPRKIIREIQLKYHRFLADSPAEKDENVNWFKTDLYRKIAKEITPAMLLKDLREAQELSQKQLGEILNIPGNRISDFETGHRAISKDIAKKLSKVLNVSASRFI
jgi:ribosome-binding protein aMBF1 (putative translation factor)